MRKWLLVAFTAVCVHARAQEKTAFSVSYNPVGKGFTGLAALRKTADSFSIESRRITGLPFTLLGTDQVTVQGDSVSGRMHIAQFPVLFEGRATPDAVHLRLKDPKSGDDVGDIESLTTAPAKKDYVLVSQQMVDSTEKLIFNKSYVQSPAWEKYKINMLSQAVRIQDDLELMILFFLESRQLPFSHYMLTRFSKDDFETMDRAPRDNAATAALSYPAPATALLKVNSFAGDGSRLDSLMKEVLSKKTQYLVIDLRGNSGGNAGAAMRLAQYLLPERAEMGALVTRRWFDTHPAPPVPADYASLVPIDRSSTLSLTKAFSVSPGFVLVAEPARHQFTGDLYVLTDNQTASTCEPFVYGLQQQKRATVVGAKTAGAMLARVPVRLSDDFVLFIPMADYFTFDGKRLDQVGVVPDVETKEGNALEKALSLIRQNNTKR